MQIINSILSILYREYLLTFRNFYDVMTIIVFFILGILIFVFSIGPNKEIYSQIGVGIIWTLLLLSTNLSIKKLFYDDFNDGSLILLYISGLSLDLFVINGFPSQEIAFPIFKNVNNFAIKLLNGPPKLRIKYFP